MACGVKVNLKGFRIDKNGKLVKSQKGQSVSEKIRQKKSKRVKVIRAPIRTA